MSAPTNSPLPFHLLPDTATVDDHGRLSIGGCDVADLADRHGTPLFVYDEAHIRARCREAVSVLGDGATYASKAFLCRAVARLVHEEGMRVDVATGGELQVVLAAGVPAERTVLHGNNKSLDELRLALTAGVGRIVIDSDDELDRIESLVASGLPVPRVLLRINPGIEVHTHEHVRTGNLDSKFGFPLPTGQADDALARARASAAVDLVGLHMHIGSQVFSVENFLEGLRAVAPFVVAADLPELVVGGGLGVAYVEGEAAPTITEWATAVVQECRAAGITAEIGVEPGRAVVGAAAVTLYTVGTVKFIPGVRTYVSVDGGMSDNPRPVLYGSGYETFLPRAATSRREMPIRLVGKHCESGDLLVREGRVPADLAVGDVIATPVTGAYGHSMGSNYNKVLRPAVVFVADGVDRLVVRRETVEDLLATDVG
ncbi:MAG TPA: diaminopimelate decarboxylase [Microthrixaceae bacterium]|nr:diaminopimelate decarboxylase [Microthrixaceae bacterium]HNA35089.1 diaminopimelate decarboxylase [Microthrixaceae bacterium]HNB93674.1 diaminopimelate decarboxylase [Microthrixaceae bacterium]HNE34868.1 diaminopimelate decarboxylase [Microthrixaceae bacterium]HNJ22235.1 diaminopimelate decarboxylase [Microthrixaceae bacterium]